MNTAMAALDQFFTLKNIELPQEGPSVLDSSEGMSAVKELILRHSGMSGWGVLSREILKKGEDLLKIEIPDILTAAWNKYHILRQYLDPNKYPSDESFLVPLAEHTIISEHHPYLEIMVNDQPVGKITFTIVAALTLEGVILKIEDGRIKAIFTGACRGKGTIKCEELVLLEEETKSLALPETIDLGEGIAIASREG